MVPGRGLFRRARARFVDDLRKDPYLPWLLILAGVLSGFWFWHRLPNTATRDEWSRLLDPLMAFRSVVADPGLEGLREGVAWGRTAFGATFYVFGLALFPMIAIAVLTGQLDAITGPPASGQFWYFPLWNEIPAWFWTGSLAMARLINVAFAVGSVYLTYRMGVAIADRPTGRLAGLLLTLSFGFLTIAHEGGEDMPALFFLLSALYLLIRYVQTGHRWAFLAASGAGGVAIAFKLTTVPIVGLVGVAFVLRARRDADWPKSLFRPRLLVAGATIGFGMILLGFPTAVVGEYGYVVDRIVGGPVHRIAHPTGPDAPISWWFLRGFLSGLGLPLFAASVGSVAAALLRTGSGEANSETGLVVTGFLAFVALFVPWHDFRVHHLLPTFPLIAVLVAAELERLRSWMSRVGRVLTAAIVLSSAIYAGVGVVGYADMPRDQAVDWMKVNADENATIEVYRRHFQDTAIPHGMTVNHPEGPDDINQSLEPCPEYIQLGYRDLLYLNGGDYYRHNEARAEYIRSLLEGEYGYEIVAEFGSRPPDFVPQRATPGSYVELLPYGIYPQTDQYADEQELAANQYTVILESTGECKRSRDPPF